MTLVNFGQSVLKAPPRAGRRHNVASSLKKRTLDSLLTTSSETVVSHRLKLDSSASMAAAVRAKIEDGNIRAAARIICSEEKPADENDATLYALQQRHPQAPADRRCPPDPSLFAAVQITEDDITRAIRSFPTGSSAGPDGLRPQHLLDLTSCLEAGRALVTAVTGLINLLLQGQCPPEVATVLFGGRLFALQKKSGGIRPIAIGYTWRRL